MMLGVCQHGNNDGAPFNKLFSESRLLSPGKCDLTDVTAILLWGGEDISPSLYNQKPNKFNEATPIPSRRDLFEWALMKEAVQKGIPLIGVCRGAQLMCAFAGGSLAQDVSGHQSGHSIVTGDQAFSAPGNHHQMMLPPDGAELLAWAGRTPEGKRRAEYYIDEDNAITYFPQNFREPEAVYFPNIKGVGFQFHPEWANPEHICVSWCLDVIKEKLL